MTDALYDPFDANVIADPYPHYSRLRRDAPVYEIAGTGMWAVSRHADVMAVLHDPAAFSSEAMAALVQGPANFVDEPLDDEPRRSVIGTDGAEHARLRGIVSRGFTPTRIASLESSMRATARGLLAAMLDHEAVDLIADYAIPLPVTAIAEMLGIDADRRADFRRWSDAMMLAVFEQPTTDQGREIAECLQEISTFLAATMEEREREPGDDLISVLLRAELEHGRLSRAELETFVITLLVPGSVTTTHLIGNALVALFADRDAFDWVASDASLIPAVVEETLRFDAPVQLLPRLATRDVSLAGTTIPGGAIVLPLFGSANRDERVFPDADRFDVTRRPREHVAFGHGPHFCLGAALARLEARVALEELFAMTHDIRLDAPVTRVSSFVFRGPARLPATLTLGRRRGARPLVVRDA